jgi:hypothetical protein
MTYHKRHQHHEKNLQREIRAICTKKLIYCKDGTGDIDVTSTEKEERRKTTISALPLMSIWLSEDVVHGLVNCKCVSVYTQRCSGPRWRLTAVDGIGILVWDLNVELLPSISTH